MDAKSFGDFLVKKLNEHAKAFESHLLSAAFTKLEDYHRAAGIRETLVDLSTKMGGLLDDYQKDVNGASGDVQ